MRGKDIWYNGTWDVGYNATLLRLLGGSLHFFLGAYERYNILLLLRAEVWQRHVIVFVNIWTAWWPTRPWRLLCIRCLGGTIGSRVLRRIRHQRRLPCGGIKHWHLFGWLWLKEFLPGPWSNGYCYFQIGLLGMMLAERIVIERVFTGLVFLVALLCVSVDPLRAGWSGLRLKKVSRQLRKKLEKSSKVNKKSTYLRTYLLAGLSLRRFIRLLALSVLALVTAAFWGWLRWTWRRSISASLAFFVISGKIRWHALSVLGHSDRT